MINPTSPPDASVQTGGLSYVKLYIAVRADLPPGLQAAQIVHAAFQFAHDHPSVVKPWLEQSNYLVIVSVPDEDALLDLIFAASKRGLKRSATREPDIGNEATAVAIEPGTAAAKLCAQLPLALKPDTGAYNRYYHQGQKEASHDLRVVHNRLPWWRRIKKMN